MTARGLIVSAPRSGSGKTSVTLGLLAAFARRGLSVRGVKAGPDYIDTAFHAAATGRPGLNLDSWAMPPDLLGSLAADAACDADLLLIEGAMGLFDGVACEAGRRGSVADLAARFGIPVLMVLDVSGQSQTAAALAHGLATFDPAVRVGGVVLNRVGSDRHQRLVSEAIEAIGLPVVGSLARDATPVLPERHLGLVQAEEHPALQAYLDRMGELAEVAIDLDAVAALASPLPPADLSATLAMPPPGQRIALARDAAFSFVYPHLLAGWRRAGAEIVAFSPLADESPPADCDACWLPGGYPELHAGRLAAAGRFHRGIHAFAATKPVHGECGGYMALGQALIDAEGMAHAMLGLLGHTTSFARRRLHLGYREARLVVDCALGPRGGIVRGHEFHYAKLAVAGDDAPLAELADGVGSRLGPAGGRRGHVGGTFFHAIARI